ncbi:MAG: hypothetical protein A2W61_03085 [Deltaproteobacteria bacterium RIFCSPLOWO2_01_44_7]|nr:MAG: hypothetical protein A2712_02565 [Deltaproteobacteria bacterium RIFCSPHIGHO2_01_FULL_43_49]OGQ16079.1 MAG: hypothetical protein A3D22_00535 [Deltaproteobacteria bacterium RIFCSPHIGHO2_02_FULL_44_53]OGQ29040.1 MAG: hypothetical protein A3D98_04320 [Deltaproteobacteria bacterium RIFCSPHIGHO2_12_FULL_44_21]OGQ32596.1 MAG: hypothetical protein A2979_08465 [Deltaproteobacteria bacterium RIFCSPLOWO2_01_FULL_45_74]OGQ38338.1 MAG: hypothetical protein A2W61_03085 [Deltaproteobacteria bacterium 
MKIIVTIAVRMKSARLPNKAVVEICGKPLISHLIERVRCAKKPDAVVLCTSHLPEDAVLIQEALKSGIPFLAGSPEDVFQRFMDAATQYNADHVVRVTGDNPLTDPEYIDRLVQKHLAENNEYTMVDYLPLGAASEVISIKAIARARDELKDRSQSEYMPLYLNKPKKYKVGVFTADDSVNRPHYRLTVDTPSDLELIRIIYKELYRPGKIFSLEETVAFLDANLELLDINNQIEQKYAFLWKGISCNKGKGVKNNEIKHTK